MKKIINYFLQGLLYIVPITATGAFVVWSFKKIDGLIERPMEEDQESGADLARFASFMK